jgi:hypothetical protein
MNPEIDDQNQQVSGAGPLGQILSTELGVSAPVEDYHRPLQAEDRNRLESELEAVERAQAEAASKLPNIYAG